MNNPLKPMVFPESIKLNQPRINDIQVVFPGCIVVEFIGLADGGEPKNVGIDDISYEKIASTTMKMRVHGELVATPVKYAVYQDKSQEERITKDDAATIVTAIGEQRALTPGLMPVLAGLARKYYKQPTEKKEEEEK
jgi:hypothetical protein